MKTSAYKSLAISVQKIATQGRRKLIITSSGPHEGKSTVAVNLGRALARNGRESVVLIDADPYKPTLHNLIGVKNQRGLGDLLKEVYQIDLNQENPNQFGLGDWIELVRAQSRSGRLTIRQAKETFRVHFERGAITSFYAAQRGEEQMLGSLLVERGRITGEQRVAALQVQQEGHRRLGEVLSGLGYVGSEDLQDALQTQLKECLHRIVTLQNPEYEFREVAESFRTTLTPRIGDANGGNGHANGHGNGHGNGNGNGHAHGNGHAAANGANGVLSGRFLDYLRQPYLSSQIPSYLADTGMENFKVLTAGSSPYELADPAFPILIDRLARSFDVVLLDCPPVAMTSPTTLLSECSDGVLMVVKAEGYEIGIVQQARDQLLRSGANILGVILNHVNVSQDRALSYYYGAYHL